LESLQWYLKLIDQMSGPAKVIAQTLRGVDTALKTVRQSVGATLEGIRKFASGADHMINIGERVVHVFRRIGEAAKEGIVFAVEAAAFKEQTLLAFETILRSKKAAQETMQEAVRFAAATPFTTKDVISSYRALLTGGFSRAEIPIVMRGVGDFAAMNGLDPAVMERVIFHLRQIRAEGRLTGMQMHQLALAGLPVARVYEQLAKMLGTDVAGAMAKLHAGEVGSQGGLFAILSVVKEMAGGRLGGLLDRSSQTVTGLLSTIRSRPHELMMQLDESAGFNSLRRFLKMIADVFDPNSSNGQAIIARATRMFDTIMGGLDKITPESVTSAFDRVAGVVERLLPVLVPTGDKLERLVGIVENLGAAVTGMLPMFEKLASLASTIGRGWGLLFGASTTAGSLEWSATRGLRPAVNTSSWAQLTGDAQERIKRVALAGGIGSFQGADDFVAGMPMRSAGARAGDMLAQGARDALGVHSPSDVFEDIGRQSAAGFRIGFQGPRSSAAGGGRAVTVEWSGDLILHAEGAGAGGLDLKHVGQQLRDMILEQLGMVGEQLAIEVGEG
jgi:tape measure domain-containing protein